MQLFLAQRFLARGPPFRVRDALSEEQMSAFKNGAASISIQTAENLKKNWFQGMGKI